MFALRLYNKQRTEQNSEHFLLRRNKTGRTRFTGVTKDILFYRQESSERIKILLFHLTERSQCKKISQGKSLFLSELCKYLFLQNQLKNAKVI